MAFPTDLFSWSLAILLGFILFTVVTLKLSVIRRRKVLTQERDGVTSYSFAGYLAEFGCDPIVARAAYRYLREVHKVQFPILPSDHLEEDLGLEPEDIVQAIYDLTHALGREYTPVLRRQSVATAEDLVRLIQSASPVARPQVA